MTRARLACAALLGAAVLAASAVPAHPATTGTPPPARVVLIPPDLTGHPLRAAWPWTPRVTTRGPRP